MYKISREFSFPMGHRLSKNSDRCQFFHGHNFKIIVGLKSKTLDYNDMVMDFGDLKKIVERFIDSFCDHVLAVNEADGELIDAMKQKIPDLRVCYYSQDPTAEVLAKNIFSYCSNSIILKDVYVDFVTVYENDKSSATYTDEEWST